MKLLVFAHTPPPHHGQSYMVQLMLAGFGGDRCKRAPQTHTAAPEHAARYGIACYHVNARLSRKLEDIGSVRPAKLVLLLGYCLQALWCRVRFGVTNFYYVPAPGQRSALLRDWVVMLLCRPFFKRIILHWHAAGLSTWLDTAVPASSRWLTYRLLKHVDLSIVLSAFNRADAEKFLPRQIQVVSNGIPDPCPDFEREILPRRNARFAARGKILAGGRLTDAELENTGGDPQIFRILFLAHCTREKGLFDTAQAVLSANRQLAASGSPISLHLQVAGNFVTAEEKAGFDLLLADPQTRRFIAYTGFISGEEKHAVLKTADLFCFPTCYRNENQPVNLIEAMAYGLPILTTRWRSLPELLPANYPGLVDIRSPEQIAATLPGLMIRETGEAFRRLFLRQFTLDQHLAGLADALHSLEQSRPAAAPATMSAAPPRPSQPRRSENLTLQRDVFLAHPDSIDREN